MRMCSSEARGLCSPWLRWLTGCSGQSSIPCTQLCSLRFILLLSVPCAHTTTLGRGNPEQKAEGSLSSVALNKIQDIERVPCVEVRV